MCVGVWVRVLESVDLYKCVYDTVPTHDSACVYTQGILGDKITVWRTGCGETHYDVESNINSGSSRRTGSKQ